VGSNPAAPTISPQQNQRFPDRRAKSRADENGTIVREESQTRTESPEKVPNDVRRTFSRKRKPKTKQEKRADFARLMALAEFGRPERGRR
jgi:hypothetical protein